MDVDADEKENGGVNPTETQVRLRQTASSIQNYFYNYSVNYKIIVSHFV